MTRRSQKKDSSLTTHMPQFRKEQLMKLAEQQRAGQGASEYVYENLIIPHLEQIEHETKIRQKIFGLTENYKNCEHRTDLSVRSDLTDIKKA
ncbi:hypothetical protein [Acinetobacter bereziniae]|uniref:hypothetical protein n=1 Tax=Acinetobacter bereziniae TaxID=106648 RepID=UPI00300AFD24